MTEHPARSRRPRLAATLGVVALAATLSFSLGACSGADPVPRGTPMPPAAVTSPTPVPSALPFPTVVPSLPPTTSPGAAGRLPSVPVRSSDLGAQPASVVVPPTHLTIAAVDIDMQVLPMGVDSAGQMQLPDDSNQAGWYEYGPTPADGVGTTVIAAHVDSLVFGLGQFVRLRDITEGETLALTTGDGVQHVYTVAQITRTPKTEVALDEIFDRDGAARLVLVTCGGVFDRDTGHYRDNVIVTATPAL